MTNEWADVFRRGNITDAVLDEVQRERDRQHARFGEQNHPDVNTLESPTMTRAGYLVNADSWKIANDYRLQRGFLAWDGLLLEEVFEALTESDPALIRTELIQVAALAVAWIEAIDRRESS